MEAFLERGLEGCERRAEVREVKRSGKEEGTGRSIGEESVWRSEGAKAGDDDDAPVRTATGERSKGESRVSVFD